VPSFSVLSHCRVHTEFVQMTKISTAFGPAVALLCQDVAEADGVRAFLDTQFHRRNYVRAHFAFLDGFSFSLRQSALKRLGLDALERTETNVAKMSLLYEQSPTLTDTGKVQLQPLRVSFLSHLAFTLRLYAEEAKINTDFFGDDRWNDLRQAVRLRHRLTHPKDESDLTVTDEDLNTVAEANKWIANVLRKLADGLEANGA
jgi:hypothetical protein